MGCDIHIRIWTKDPEPSKSIDWSTTPPTERTRDSWAILFPAHSYGRWNLDALYYNKRYLGVEEDFKQDREFYKDMPLNSAKRMVALAQNDSFRKAEAMFEAIDQRNYKWFAVLGNVRNGHGFAGIKTGEEIPYIGDCRPWADLPFFDQLPEFKGGYPEHDENNFWYGDHSWSWVKLRELLDYNWGHKRTGTGVIPLAVEDAHNDPWERASYESLRGNHGRPDTWSGAISGPGIHTIFTDQADAILDNRVARLPGIRYYVQYTWEETIEEAVGKDLVEHVRWLGTMLPPDDTYFVFGFDS